MAGWNIEQIKRWAFLIFSLWALLAFVAWHRIENCSSMFSEYCLGVYERGFLKFLSLAWVWEYQTLLAGVLALLGASTVLNAAKYTTERKQEAEDRKQKTAAEVACVIVSAEFRDEIIKLQNLLTAPQTRRHFTNPPFPQSYMYLPTLSAISPQLGPIVAARIRDVVNTLRNPDGINIVSEIAYSEVIFYMLSEIPQHLSEDGRYDMASPTKLRSKHLRSTLSDLNMTLEQIIGLRYFFDNGVEG